MEEVDYFKVDSRRVGIMIDVDEEEGIVEVVVRW